MGKKSTPKAPTPPDPVATANAQAAANRDAAITQAQINQVNQRTPYGSLTYEQRGTTAEGTPQYTAVQTLSPDQQKQLDLTNQAGINYGEIANRQLNQVGSKLSSPLDFGSLGPAPQANEQTRQSVANSLLAQLQPQFDRDRSALDTRLANQGVTPGSTAYTTAIDELNRAKTNAELQANSQAESQMAQQYQLQQQARNQQISEMLQQRQEPLNELASMLTGAQVQSPSFINAPQEQVNPGDIMDATYASNNAAMNAYNQQMQRANANTQGLYSLLGAGAGAAGMAAGGGAFSFSDRRLKTDIRRIGHAEGLDIYAFRYVWGGPEHIGVMAQDVLKVKPWAVAMHESGYLMVNYAWL